MLPGTGENCAIVFFQKIKNNDINFTESIQQNLGNTLYVNYKKISLPTPGLRQTDCGHIKSRIIYPTTSP